MKSNFQKVMPYIFSEEGGYADNPADPGGATNMGITIATLSAWDGHQVSPEDVKEMTPATATQIYQAQFWNKIDGDNLPSGLDYALFDFSVNSGPARAARMLQGILGLPEDGIIGAQTVAAANMRSTDEVINALCDARASWLEGLSTASTFGKAGSPVSNGCVLALWRSQPTRPSSMPQDRRMISHPRPVRAIWPSHLF